MRKKFIWCLALVFFIVSPAFGQAPLDIVTKHRAAYPTIIPQDQLDDLLLAIVTELGPPYGRLRKASGRNCAGFSCDVICAGQGQAQQQWDVFSSSGNGMAGPMWEGPMTVPNIRVDECVVPSTTWPTPPPTDPPTPDPPTVPACDLSTIDAKLAQCLAEIGAVRADLTAHRTEVQKGVALLSNWRFWLGIIGGILGGLGIGVGQ